MHLTDALDVAVAAILRKPTITKKLGFETLFGLIEQRPDARLSANINVPIIYALAEKSPRAIYTAYDEFRESLGVERPTELFGRIEDFGRGRLIPFLHRVCIPKVLARSVYFEGTDDLEQERLQICQFLSSIDPDGLKTYSLEINAITERSMIRRGMRQIEESKIYVDENGIRTRGRALFYELFERLQAFASLKRTQPHLTFADPVALVSFFEQDEKGQLVLVEKLVPRDGTSHEGMTLVHVAHFAHFKDMFLEIRDRFVSSNEHGLDAYLSTRIRHGTLQGEIRSIFERLHLIAQRNKISGQYLQIAYWNEKLDHRNYNIDAIQNLLAEFSRKVDELIDRLRRTNVQVSKEDRRGEGWLDFSFSERELLRLLTQRFSNIQKFEEFMDEVFRVLWERTEIVLEYTRKRISTDITREVYDALQHLLQNVRALVPAKVAPELHGNLTKGLTNIQNEFDRISNWFTISRSTLLTEFTLQDIVSICTASINNTYPAKPIAPTVAISTDLKFSGKHFAHFSDVFRALFDNIILHCGLAAADMRVKVIVNAENNFLDIIVQNALAVEVRARDPVSILQNRVRTFQRNAQQDLIRKEGGSGVAKIQKILWSDLQRSASSIDFHYDAENELRATIRMEVEGLLA